MNKPRIIILGAGVAGLRIAEKLNNKLKPGEADLLLIDENDYHQLLYNLPKVFSYVFDDKEVKIPLVQLIDKISFKQVIVETTNPEENTVETSQGKIEYDILVSALGSHPAYFGLEGVRENSVTLSNYTGAMKVRESILQLYGEASDTDEVPMVVIGGAGFTGVEVAGALCEFIEDICMNLSLEVPDIKLHLVEASPSILPGWDEGLALEGARYLERKGVKLYLGEPVVEASEGRLKLRSGIILEPDLFIWTAGVEADPACSLLFEKRSRRIVVNEYLQQPEFDNVFILGDQACTVDFSDNPVPPNAHVAMGQADTVVNNIQAMLRGKPLRAFKFGRVGEVVTFGEEYALGTFFGVTFRGFVAKLMKRLIHLWYVYSIGGLQLVLEYL